MSYRRVEIPGTAVHKTEAGGVSMELFALRECPSCRALVADDDEAEAGHEQHHDLTEALHHQLSENAMKDRP